MMDHPAKEGLKPGSFSRRILAAIYQGIWGIVKYIFCIGCREVSLEANLTSDIGIRPLPVWKRPECH
jgi:hypothetical protein